MYEIIMQLPFNGFYVKGTLALPVKAKSIIIFSHGFGSTFKSPHEQKIAKKLQQEGFGTLVFDLLDQHEELPDEYKDLGLLSRGLITSTEWLHGHSEYKSMDLAFLGSGRGGATALKAATKLGGSVVKAVVSLSGRLDLVRKELSKVPCPTLLIVGELDFQGVNINRDGLKHLKSQKQLAVIPGASHLFEEPDKTNEAAHIAISWFKKYLTSAIRLPLFQQK